MASTTNYGWVKPTVSSDVGAWGGIANTIFDSIDAQVKTIETAAAAADAKALVAQVDVLEVATQIRHGSEGIEINGSNPVLMQKLSAAANFNSGMVSGREIWYRLEGLCAGLRITAFYSRAIKSTGGSALMDCALLWADGLGTSTLVSAGHSHTTAEATLTTSGLSHDIVAGRIYYIRMNVQADTGSAFVRHVGLTVSRP